MSAAHHERRLLTSEEAARGLRHVRGVLFASVLWLCVALGWAIAAYPSLALWLVALGAVYACLWLPIVLHLVARDLAERTERPRAHDILL